MRSARICPQLAGSPGRSLVALPSWLTSRNWARRHVRSSGGAPRHRRPQLFRALDLLHNL